MVSTRSPTYLASDAIQASRSENSCSRSSLEPLRTAWPARGAARLDLRSGDWDRHHGHLRHLGQLDVGHRLITAET